MASTDDVIGSNVQQIRGSRSQLSVADAMRALGWSWAQNTVSQVERGDRPLRLGEAEDLAGVLGVDVGTFLAAPSDVAISQIEFRHRIAGDNIALQLHAYFDDQLMLAAESFRAERQGIEVRHRDAVLRTLAASPERLADDVRLQLLEQAAGVEDRVIGVEHLEAWWASDYARVLREARHPWVASGGRYRYVGLADDDTVTRMSVGRASTFHVEQDDHGQHSEAPER